MKTFYHLLANNALTGIVNGIIWFALTFWVYLETKNVMATATMGGIYSILAAFSSIIFGKFVDKYKSKPLMIYSSIFTTIFLSIAALIYFLAPKESFSDFYNIYLWLFIISILIGTIAGNIRGILMMVSVTRMIEEEKRAQVNGIVGTIAGTTFLITSVLSGFAIANLGVFGMLLTGIVINILIIFHALTLTFEEKIESHENEKSDNSISEAIKEIGKIPGMWGLIAFNMLNNLVAGVFMAIMDPYGLELLGSKNLNFFGISFKPEEMWGLIFGFVSLGFIVGGILVAKLGIGKNPLKTIIKLNILMWIISISFTFRENIFLLVGGLLLTFTFFPMIEAAEQTLMQKVVPEKVQGRVFGFGQTLEQASQPMTAFLVGPITQFITIPFMAGNGKELLAPIIGTGETRGIALVIIVASIIGLFVTLLASKTKAFKILGQHYEK